MDISLVHRAALDVYLGLKGWDVKEAPKQVQDVKRPAHRPKGKPGGGATPGKSPIAQLVRKLDGEYYLAHEAAQQAGCHVNTVRKYTREKTLMPWPYKYVFFGKTRVYLYTPAHIAWLKQYVNNRLNVEIHEEAG